MSSPLRLGLFGGSFDPVHHGHLLLARDAVEKLGLDRIHLVPAALNPFKSGVGPPPAPGPHRLEMLRLALAGEERMVADDRELRRPPPSYAVDTVRELQAEHPGARIFLLIGQDNLAGLPAWREFGALRELAEFVVFLREGSGAPETCPYARLERRVEISSTEIRNRVASGRSLRYLMPDPVERHIRRNQLYLHPFPAEGNHIPTSPPA